jgi:hypothetical protein
LGERRAGGEKKQKEFEEEFCNSDLFGIFTIIINKF